MNEGFEQFRDRLIERVRFDCETASVAEKNAFHPETDALYSFASCIDLRSMKQEPLLRVRPPQCEHDELGIKKPLCIAYIRKDALKKLPTSDFTATLEVRKSVPKHHPGKQVI